MWRNAVKLLFLAALLLVLAGQVTAQEGITFASESPTMPFDKFLEAASGPWIAAIVALVLSWVCEYWPKYQEWPPKFKRLAYFGLALVVPLLAALLRGVLGYAPWSFDPLIWSALWNGAAAGGIGTVMHIRKPAEMPVA